MAKVADYIMKFAGANMKVYEMFRDYFNHYRANHGEKVEYKSEVQNEQGQLVKISFAEKEDQMNQALKKEVMRVAGISDMTQFPLETWSTHPMLKWAAFAVVNSMIDMVLPETIEQHTNMFAEVRNLSYGDSAAFTIKPRDLFTVTKVGNNKRKSEINKVFSAQKTLSADPRALTVGVSLYGVLCGKESLADLTARVIRSMETEFAYDVYSAFKTALDAVDNTASTGLRTAGYTEDEFVRISQAVSVWNGNSQPIAVGTLRALKNILPNDVNYRYDIDSPFVKLGYIKNFNGVDIMVLPQIADMATPFGVRLANDRIWFVSPGSDKIVKAVLEGATLAHTDDTYANADLSQDTTLTKRWGMGVVTSAVAGVITL